MSYIFAAIVTILVCLLVLTYAVQADNDSHLNVWTARCNRDGGVVQTDRYGFATNDLECHKNGKIIDHEN